MTKFSKEDFERFLDAVRAGTVPVWASAIDGMPPFRAVTARMKANRKFARDFRIAAQVSAAIRLAIVRENRRVP